MRVLARKLGDATPGKKKQNFTTPPPCNVVVSHSTCPPLSSSPHAHSFVIGPAVIKHTHM
jgi:hypothetical protein